MHEQDSIPTSHKHRKHSSVIVRVSDSWASNVGSIPGQWKNSNAIDAQCVEVHSVPYWRYKNWYSTRGLYLDLCPIPELIKCQTTQRTRHDHILTPKEKQIWWPTALCHLFTVVIFNTCFVADPLCSPVGELQSRKFIQCNWVIIKQENVIKPETPGDYLTMVLNPSGLSAESHWPLIWRP